jgi:uncharacterized protein
VSRRARWITTAWLLAAGGVQAQSNWSQVPVPIYSPTQFVLGVYRFWAVPQATEFEARSAALTPAVQAVCNASARDATSRLDAARTGWRATAISWDHLTAVAIGPLIERRSQRQLDFNPTRPALIAAAIDAAPADAAAMERIGTPAKGLPALEWLLWQQPRLATSPACGYAVQVAADIEREARALAVAYRQAADRPWDDESEALAAMSEIVNQWVAGVERLRFAQMEKPLKKAGASVPVFPRALSGSSAASWAAQWQSLRAVGLFANGVDGDVDLRRRAAAAPQPGMALVPLETYLRGKGRNSVANALVAAGAQVDAAIKPLIRSATGARPAGVRRAPDAGRVMAASTELAALKRLAEAQLAPALQVSLDFTSADGD